MEAKDVRGEGGEGRTQEGGEGAEGAREGAGRRGKGDISELGFYSTVIYVMSTHFELMLVYIAE